MLTLKRSLLILIGVLALCNVEARADSFVVTNINGNVFVATFSDFGPPTLKLPPILGIFGPGLSITTRFPPVGDVGNVESRDACIVSGCTPGTVVGTNSTFSGLIGSSQSTMAFVNGVSYTFVNVTCSMNFVSSPIVIPNGGGDFTVTLPFTFSGNLTGDAFQLNVVNPIFTATLSGQGLANLCFFRGYSRKFQSTLPAFEH